MKQQANKDDGFSLVMSLIFISLLSVLVVGFLTSMRVEVFSSDAHLRAVMAKNYADAGTDMAVARLRAATANTTSVWISQPGQITTFVPPVGSTSSTVAYPLHSGAGSYNDSVDTSADLNNGTNYLITTATDKLRVKWIYARKDGTLEMAPAAGAPSYSASNPIVGRFAFWADDESARINLNTAYTRNASISQVNLGVFPTFFPSTSSTALNQLLAYRTGTNSGHYLNTVNEARAVSATLASLINSNNGANRFLLTSFNRAPDLNMFGEPRIVLTTQESLANGRPYLKILADNYKDGDPGRVQSDANGTIKYIDPVYYAQTVATLAKLITRTGWPYAPAAASLKDKYQTATGSRAIRAEAIAINIIDYVRAKESAIELVQPTRGPISATGSYTLSMEDSTGYMSNNRGIRITEVKLDVLNYTTDDKNWAPPLGTAPALSADVAQRSAYDVHKLVLTAELHLSTYSGLSSVDLRTLSIVTACTPPFPVYWNQNGTPPVGLNTPVVNTTTVSATTPTAAFVYFSGQIDNATALSAYAYNAFNQSTSTLLAGGYVKVMLTMSSPFAYVDASSSPRTARRRSDATSYAVAVALRDSNGVRIDYVGPDLPCKTPFPDVDSSVAVDDPYVNRCGSGDWVQQSETKMSFGLPPGSDLLSIGKASTIAGLLAPQDLDNNGVITNVGCRFPAAAGKLTAQGGVPANPYGVMESVAELGYVHTGTERTNSGMLGGVPYRTLRFQPRPTVDASKVPDWVLMDMFSVPTKRWLNLSDKSKGTVNILSYSQSIVSATTSSLSQWIDGQVNLNSTISPTFTIGVGPATITRADPLKAAFLGVYTNAALTTTLSTTAASTLVTSSISALATATSGSRYGFGTTYLSRGEIAEIRGVADSGEESEVKLRGTVDFLTTRGSAFRVYSIGQSLLQSSAGAITIMGEKRIMSVVERVGPTSSTTSAQFKTIYSGKPY